MLKAKKKPASADHIGKKSKQHQRAKIIRRRVESRPDKTRLPVTGVNFCSQVSPPVNPGSLPVTQSKATGDLYQNLSARTKLTTSASRTGSEIFEKACKSFGAVGTALSSAKRAILVRRLSAGRAKPSKNAVIGTFKA